MLHINIVCIGKVKEEFFRNAIQEYSKRLSKYSTLKIVELPDEKIPNNLSDKNAEIIKDKECESIISSLAKDTYLICLDLSGKQFSSEDFAHHIDDIAVNIKTNITFVIGGSLGLNSKLLSMANEKICFSKMKGKFSNSLSII